MIEIFEKVFLAWIVLMIIQQFWGRKIWKKTETQMVIFCIWVISMQVFSLYITVVLRNNSQCISHTYSISHIKHIVQELQYVCLITQVLLQSTLEHSQPPGIITLEPSGITFISFETGQWLICLLFLQVYLLKTFCFLGSWMWESQSLSLLYHTSIILTHSVMGEHSVDFHIFVILNKAAINSNMHAFKWLPPFYSLE